jgi:crossover junction endodeoxyribonuclease RusA
VETNLAFVKDVFYEFEVPFPPSVNGLYRVFKGRTIVSKQCREYKKTVIAIMTELGLANKNIDDRLRLYLELHAPTKRKYDLDNRLKVLLDALQASGFITDDEQIDSLHVERGVIMSGGKTIVRMEMFL